jgi:hypothetical protein
MRCEFRNLIELFCRCERFISMDPGGYDAANDLDHRQ